MSVALTDVLIELSDPNSLFEFKNDPDSYLRGKGLTSEERSMLANGDKKGIRLFAKSVNSADKTQQFNRYGCDALLANIDPVVHLDLQANDNVAAAGAGTLFVRDDGLVLRAYSSGE